MAAGRADEKQNCSEQTKGRGVKRISRGPWGPKNAAVQRMSGMWLYFVGMELCVLREGFIAEETNAAKGTAEDGGHGAAGRASLFIRAGRSKVQQSVALWLERPGIRINQG